MNKLALRLILCDIRSAHNVGAIFRTADACGIEHVYVTGYTPYPRLQNDSRPPHVSSSNTSAIAKTALGAERTMSIGHFAEPSQAILHARSEGFTITVLEQSEKSLNLFNFKPAAPLALVLGNEVTGVPQNLLQEADQILELPMLGAKESLNVAVTGAVAMYRLRFG